MLVDSHAHLEAVEDLEGVITRSKDSGISKIITIGTSLDSSRKAIESAEKFSDSELQIYATVGIHPQDGRQDFVDHESKIIDEIRKIAKSSEKVVGIGECGLDYFDESNGKNPSSDKEKGFQRDLFVLQIEIAQQLDLPLVVHCRNGWDEIFSKLSVKNKGVFHCWTGNVDAYKKAMAIGFYVSFSGILTFENAKDIQEVARIASLDKLLIETDSPFLAPVPFRGQKNEPKNVKIIADQLSSLQKLPFVDVSETTSLNAKKLFGI